MIALPKTRGHRQRLAAGQYREQAAQAMALAGAATLDRVRERHEAAAATWRNLAIIYERNLLARQAPASSRMLAQALDLPNPTRS
jgi:hypothetical protein